MEKESRIRETMLMMGLKQWVLWSTWYLKEFLFLMIPVIVICILLKVTQLMAVIMPIINYHTAGNFRWCKLSYNSLLTHFVVLILAPSPYEDHTYIYTQ